MKRLLTLIAATIALSVAATTPVVPTVTIDSVAYRKDLTRVYCKITGRPHTSDRIDRADCVDSKGRAYAATDIDGVDFKRYFQWEDDPYIALEIDFPPMRRKIARLTLQSVKGPIYAAPKKK